MGEGMTTERGIPYTCPWCGYVIHLGEVSWEELGVMLNPSWRCPNCDK